MAYTGQTVGYIRVSSADQNEARQREALGEVDEMFIDKKSGKSRDGRVQLAAMMKHVREGDTVRVKSIDRLARSTQDLLAIVKELTEKGVEVEFVDTPTMNIDTAQGELMLSVMAAFAKFERAIIKERQAEGIKIAKAKGTYEKRRKMDDEKIAEAQRLRSEGVAVAKIARDLGVSRPTVLKYTTEPVKS